MKIEILLCESINEQCTNMTCFDASDIIKRAISKQKSIQGIVLINGNAVKFNFSPMTLGNFIKNFCQSADASTEI